MLRASATSAADMDRDAFEPTGRRETSFKPGTAKRTADLIKRLLYGAMERIRDIAPVTRQDTLDGGFTCRHSL
jgi:hypothetical protein